MGINKDIVNEFLNQLENNSKIHLNAPVSGRNDMNQVLMDIRFYQQSFNCFTQLTKLLSNPKLSSDQKLQSIVELLGNSFADSLKTHAQILIKGKIFKTIGFETFEKVFSHEIKVGGEYTDKIGIGFQTKNGLSYYPSNNLIQDFVENVANNIVNLITSDKTGNELKERQKKTVANDEKYKLLVSQMKQGFVLLERVTDESGKTVTYWFKELNEAFTTLTGLNREKVIHKQFTELTEIDNDYWVKQLGNIFITDNPFEFEYFSNKSGRHLSLYIYSPNVGQIAVIITDINDRVKTERAIHKNEEHYKTLFENNQTIMFIIDPENASIVDVNPAAERFYGWTREEMKNMKIHQINVLAPDEIKIQLELAEQEKKNHFFFKHRTKLNKIIDVQVFSGPIVIRDHTFLYSFIHDNTEKLEAEKALKNSEEKHRRLTETTKSIFWEFDLPTQTWTYISPQVKNLLGYPAEKWVDFGSWANRIYHEDKESTIELCNRSTSLGEDHDMEYRFVKADGEVIWIREEVNVEMRENKPVILRGIMMDITIRKQAEEKLKASEQKFHALLKNLSVGVSLISPEMKVIQTNPMINNWFPNAVLGDKPFCYCTFSNPPQKEPCTNCPVIKTFNDGKTHEIEKQTLTNEGELFFRIVSTPVLDEEGKIAAVVEMMDNITHRKSAERALLESEEKYRTLFETMNQGVIYYDIHGEVLSVNPAARQMLGLTIGQMNGMDAITPGWNILCEGGLVYTDFKKFAAYTIQSESCNQSHNIGVHHPTKGEYIWLKINTVQEFHSGVNEPFRLYSTLTDVTQSKKNQEQLKMQNDSLEILLQTLPTPVFYKNLDGVYTGCNKAFAELMGLSTNQIVGKTLYRLCSNEDVSQYGKKDKELFDNPGKQKYEWILTNGKGEGRHVIFDKATTADAQGNIVGLVGVITDITELKLAEEANRQNAERLKALVRIFEYEAESINRLLDYALDEALNLTSSKFGYIYFYDEQTQLFSLNSWSNNVMEACNIVDLKKCYELGRTGIWGDVVRHRKEIIINDFQSDHVLRKGYPEGHVQMERFMSIPIFIHSKIVAVIGLANKSKEYNESDVNQIKLLMGSVWGLVQRKKDSEKIAKLSFAVEQSSASIIITDVAGIVEYVNPKFTQITGYSYNEAIGSSTRILNSGHHEKSLFEILWKTILSGNDWKGHLVNKKKNGDLYWESALISPIKNSKGEITNFLAIKDDITDLKRAEEALRESELKLRRMIALSPDGILLTDEKGKIMAWNNSLEKITHIPAEKALDSSLLDFHKALSPIYKKRETIEKFNAIANDLLTEGESGLFKLNTIHEVRMPFGDQNKYVQFLAFVIPSEKGNMLASFARDITQQKMAEIEVQKSEAKLRAIFNNLLQSFIIYSTEFVVQAYNQEAFNIVKKFYNQELFIGKSFLHLLPKKEEERHVTLFKKCLKGEVVAFETKLEDPDGKIFWFDMHYTPIVDSSNKVNGVFFNSIDITERKRAEDSMKRALEKEKELNDLKSQFVSTVSHEFRTPLSNILSNTQLLQRYHHRWDDEKMDISFQRIIGSVHAMTAMLEDVSLLSKNQSGKLVFRPEELDINSYIAELINEAELSLGCNGLIKKVSTLNYPKVFMDKVLLRHILLNLLTNALKYSGGHEPVKFRVLQIADQIQFIIEDSGIGIPNDEIPYIFEPFFRSSNSEGYKGTGLGMSIVKQCVDIHRGTVEIESILHKGTKISVTLPFEARF